MITTNAAWDLKNAAMAKTPIFAFAIGGQSTVYTTHDLARMGITGTLPSYQAWLQTPQGNTQSIDVQNGTSSIGEMQCVVVDRGGAVRAVVGANTLEGQTATLSVGYPGIAWNQFVTVAAFKLYKIVPVNGYGAWVFTSRDRQMLAKRTIYTHPENGELLSEDNPWFLCGSAVECFLGVTCFALGLGASDIDLAGVLALDSPEEGLYAGARPFQFSLVESFEAKQWLESEIFKPSGLYPVVTADGLYSLRSFRPPAAGAAAAFDFDEDNMVALPQIDRMSVLNECVWKYDYDGSECRREMTVLEGESVLTFGRGQQFSVESQGLRSELGAGWFAQWVSERMFQRFAGTPAGLRGGAPTCSIEAFFMSLPVWVGDYVTVSHPLMPDLLTGTLGVTDRVYEVIERTPDYARGRMKYRLLDTGLTGTGAAPVWGTWKVGEAIY